MNHLQFPLAEDVTEMTKRAFTTRKREPQFYPMRSAAPPVPLCWDFWGTGYLPRCRPKHADVNKPGDYPSSVHPTATGSSTSHIYTVFVGVTDLPHTNKYELPDGQRPREPQSMRQAVMLDGWLGA